MPIEYTYFALFVLVAAIAFLVCLRMIRAIRRVIRQINDERRRDQKQYERIQREKQLQSRAFRRGTRKINGEVNKSGWGRNTYRARREFHLDSAMDEVFDPASDFQEIHVRTPWGWPQQKGNGRTNRRSVQARPSISSQIRAGLTKLFSKKKLVDEQFLANRRLSIRALVEDRYGPVGYNTSHTGEIEWSTPALPQEYVKERETDQMTALKLAQNVEAEQAKYQALRLVGDSSKGVADSKKVSGG